MIRRLFKLGDFMRFYIYANTRFCTKPGIVVFIFYFDNLIS